MNASHAMPRSAWIFPALAVLLFGATTVPSLGIGFTHSVQGLVFAAVLLVVLFGTVFAAVHHAEVIAERVGEPFGTLLLTLAVTVIEVALIATQKLGEQEVPTLARDTVFAVVMIVCNGLVGVCILVGGLRYREQEFQITGVNVYLCVLTVMATITLVMPNYTLETPGPVYSHLQLGFVSVVTIILYGGFLYTQTIRHRDYFIGGQQGEGHAAASGGVLMLSILLLLVSLVAVVLLAKKFSLVVDAGAAAIGAPPAFAGVVVAMLVLLPESINLALGASLATIGLTIPAVSEAAYLLDKTLVLGLASRDIVLLAMTMLVSMMTFGTGRTNIQIGKVHLVNFATFLLLVFVP